MTRGVVAAGDPQTAEAGAVALRAGGNAVDAGIAASFAAFVCEPPLCSPLGGGVMVAGSGSGDLVALDFFARSPGLGAQQARELDFHDVEVDFGAAKQTFHIGRGAAAVPLAMLGLLEAHRRWGTLPLPRVVEPALALGREGYVVSDAVAYVFELLTPIVSHTAGTRRIFFDGDRIAKGGTRLRNRDLADTLEAIARDPGCVRDLYDQLVRELGVARGGLVTEGDLDALEVVAAAPVRIRCCGWRLATMPPPSSGGALVALGMRLLEGTGRLDFLSPDHVVEIARAQHRLLDVRDERFDERCRADGFVERLLSDESVARLRSSPPGWARANPLGSTTHVSVVDEHGGTLAMTMTNGEGCGHVLSGTGVHVNNLLGEEDINPAGFHADPPGRRMVTMMAPTVLRGPDRDLIVLGSGGSNRLRNAILTTVAHLVEHGVDPATAVDAPRIHVDAVALPGGGARRTVAFERTGLPPPAEEALRRRCEAEPVVFDEPSMFFGGVHVAARRGGAFGGAGDRRRGGSVRVVSD